MPQPPTLPPLADDDTREDPVDADSVTTGVPASLAFYVARFDAHAACTRALLAAGAACHAYSATTCSQIHIQALAIDAARETLAQHCESSGKSHASWQAQVTSALEESHAAVAGLECAIVLCSRTPLHAAVAARMGDSGAPASLADALHIDRLRRVAAACAADVDALRAKVHEVDATHAAVQREAAQLLGQRSECDLEELTQRCEDARALVEALQSASSTADGDAATARRLAADAPRGPPALSAADAAAALMPMHARHVLRMLPTARSAHAELVHLSDACLAAARCLAHAVCTQLAAVAALQSSMSGLRNRRSACIEAARGLETATAELIAVRNAPAAYASAVAEAMRRKAASAAFVGASSAAAERLGSIRSAEQAARDAFRSAASGSVLPARLLTALGLDAAVASVEVTVRGADGPLQQLDITAQELRRLSLDAQEGALSRAMHASQQGQHMPRSSPRRGVGAAISAALTRRASGASASLLSAFMGASSSEDVSQRTPRGGPGSSADGAAQPSLLASSTSSSSTPLELLQLRADLATAVAALAAVAAGQAARGPDIQSASAAMALQEACAAKDAVCDALRAQVAALTRRTSQLEAALEAAAGSGRASGGDEVHTLVAGIIQRVAGMDEHDAIRTR